MRVGEVCRATVDGTAAGPEHIAALWRPVQALASAKAALAGTPSCLMQPADYAAVSRSPLLQCRAVVAMLQVVLGLAVPLAVCWALERRSRSAFLRVGGGPGAVRTACLVSLSVLPARRSVLRRLAAVGTRRVLNFEPASACRRCTPRAPWCWCRSLQRQRSGSTLPPAAAAAAVRPAGAPLVLPPSGAGVALLRLPGGGAPRTWRRWRWRAASRGRPACCCC
jgi:hypothetical protein